MYACLGHGACKGERVTMSLCLWHLQPVPLGTGALIVSTRVTVTMEPSAVPMMESAGAAPAGPVSTAHSVSVSYLVSRHTVSSTGSAVELQQMTSRKQHIIYIYIFFFQITRKLDVFIYLLFLRENKRQQNRTNDHFINVHNTSQLFTQG